LALVSVPELLEAGVHFGHRTSRWNPKMGRYLQGKRNGIHIIDLRQTVSGLIRATHFLRAVTAQGYDVLFVGTKRGGKTAVRDEARRCEMPYVTERWLGGTLTNFDTIRKRLSYLEELEELETSGETLRLKKKELARHNREKRKLVKNLEGIRAMTQLPGALVIVDPRREHIAVREANRMNLPIIGIADSDCDPDPIDLIVPANDDAMRSVSIVMKRLADAADQGRRAGKQRVVETTRARMDDSTADAIANATGESGRRGPTKQVVVRRATSSAPDSTDDSGDDGDA
jgi:small subunit ribosomal protein S2